MSGLQPPPASLASFPTEERQGGGGSLYRIFYDLDRSGRRTSPWRFASVPPGVTRFDLPAPHGTCYWSDRAYGAFVEVFRGATVIDALDLSRRRLFVADHPTLRLADLLSRHAYRFGVTAEISTTPDYGLTQRWSDALHRAGFDGLLASCRHDPGSEAGNIVVFGRAGTPARRRGWRIQRVRIDRDPTLATDLRDLGVSIVAAPYRVDTIPPP